MTDKRNIVIKVKYPVSGKEAEKFTPKMITVWNIKRILLATGVLVFTLASLIFIFTKDPQVNNDADKYPEENTPDNAEIVINSQEKAVPPVDISGPEIKKDIPKKGVAKASVNAKPSNELNKKNSSISNTPIKSDLKKHISKKDTKDRQYSKVNNNVARALLTYSINNREPSDEVVQAINVDGKKPTWVYYFTELKSMNGSKVYHEWLKNGVLDSKKELIISGDAWRTSSRKLFADTEKGNWTVRLIDERGQLLNEKSFKVD